MGEERFAKASEYVTVQRRVRHQRRRDLPDVKSERPICQELGPYRRVDLCIAVDLERRI
jgi:hypothetical protein